MKSPRAVFFAGLFLAAAGAALAEEVDACKGLDIDACQANPACGLWTVMKQTVILADGTKMRRICIEVCRKRPASWQLGHGGAP
jgi:hypothetical protein